MLWGACMGQELSVANYQQHFYYLRALYLGIKFRHFINDDSVVSSCESGFIQPSHPTVLYCVPVRTVDAVTHLSIVVDLKEVDPTNML